MIEVDAAEINKILSYDDLIPALKNAFGANITVPTRQQLNYPNPQIGQDSTLLFMPAWDNREYLGVKIVTISPENGQFDLPAIQGNYILYSVENGLPLALMDAKMLTVKRTAAASALASQFLSRADSKILLMVGTGALAPEMIRAHCSVRPIEEVLIWGRNFDKAQRVAEQLKELDQKIYAVEDLNNAVSQADIISTATLSSTPLIFGKALHPGQHLDLVGAYRPDTCEADDETIKKSTIFVDTRQVVFESGDIAIPIKNEIIQEDDVAADLIGLCTGTENGRKNDSEITLFKSVGHALEDLTAAILIWRHKNI